MPLEVAPILRVLSAFSDLTTLIRTRSGSVRSPLTETSTVRCVWADTEIYVQYVTLPPTIQLQPLPHNQLNAKLLTLRPETWTAFYREI
jgi:hypothetical protein